MMTRDGQPWVVRRERWSSLGGLRGEVELLAPWYEETRRKRGRTTFGMSGATPDQINCLVGLCRGPRVYEDPGGGGGRRLAPPRRTSLDGRFTIVGLPPGIYRVTVRMGDAQPEREVRVRASERTAVRFLLSE